MAEPDPGLEQLAEALKKAHVPARASPPKRPRYDVWQEPWEPATFIDNGADGEYMSADQVCDRLNELNDENARLREQLDEERREHQNEREAHLRTAAGRLRRRR